ncbi:MAG: hypothetical protein EXQ52_01165 [Bryobacterales bacterium]|nr:hypothetical protein [Bryobacterales bacterium]
MDSHRFLALALAAAFRALPCAAAAPDWRLEIDQVTSGPGHHFFGYIGHVQNIPWNGNGRYIVGLRTAFQDRMPTPADAADVVLIDTARKNTVVVIDRTRAWNFQQGTMFYWNPKAADTQVFFNDRDPKTNQTFSVLFDIGARKRIREYRYPDVHFANSGVAQNGGFFLGLNYGRLARLRPVTGYPGAFDWNATDPAPANDGIFLVNVETGRQRLLISYREMLVRLKPKHPEMEGVPLFINHTLWNRAGNRIYFYVRGNFEKPDRVNIPCTIRPDGSGFTEEPVFIGGHPEWESESRMIGTVDGKQILYDVDRKAVVGTIGTKAAFPDPGSDIALSPDSQWLASGFRVKAENFYTIFRRPDSSFETTTGFPHPGWTSGDLRVDGAPCWNRTSDQVLFTAIADDRDRTRQMFRIRVLRKGQGK